MRLATAAAGVLLLLLLLTWLSLRAVNTNAELYDIVLGVIDHFAVEESALHRDVLSARAGVLRDYDPLVHEVGVLDQSVARLRVLAAADPEMERAIDRLAASTTRQEVLTERFKTDNALLQNSLAYFALFSERLGAAPHVGRAAPAASALAAATLRLTLDTSPSTAREVEAHLRDLARLPPPPGDADSVQALLAHGQLLHDLLPATDAVLKALHAGSPEPDQEALRVIVLARQSASRATARQFRLLLYGTSVLLVGLLVQLGLLLRERARTLQRKAAFEHVIAGVSMRFINAQPHEVDGEIGRALADMAACVGADRAYFMLSGPLTRAHLWSRPGVTFPTGWPEGALALAARLGPAMGGIIHFPSVRRMSPGADRAAFVALGLGGWACATNAGEHDAGGDDAHVILGFDAVGRPCRITRRGELSLLRMALDTIVYTVERQGMEQERARLEARLQQARRMETVGALASGIAHNFNNIIGAILGYTEMAEAQVKPHGRSARSLGEIRRAGERARDLVDQILAFGRGRQRRRESTSIRALMIETEALLRASLPSGIELVVQDAPPAAVVLAEPAQLQQVILNLCTNAAQAMDGAGRIEVEVEMREVDRTRPLSHGELLAGRYVCIAVTDAGRGMDEATLGRLFEPFFTTRSDGNGLGLATVREIVQDHGGAMHVRSAPGVGSRFEAWLARADPAQPASDGDAAALPLGNGETVLIIDNQRERLLRDEEMLAALGYEPVGFTQAVDALAACGERPERFDLVMLGHLTSLAVALELAAAIHAIRPNLPILLATASANEIDGDALVAAGISDVVHRPLVATEMAAALERGLAGQRFAGKSAGLAQLGPSTSIRGA